MEQEKVFCPNCYEMTMYIDKDDYYRCDVCGFPENEKEQEIGVK